MQAETMGQRGHYSSCKLAGMGSLSSWPAEQPGTGCLHRSRHESCQGFSQEQSGGAEPAALEEGISWKKKLEALVEENQQCCWS